MVERFWEVSGAFLRLLYPGVCFAAHCASTSSQSQAGIEPGMMPGLGTASYK